MFFFRLGYLNYMKLNTQNMVTPFKADRWYDVDLLINWDEKKQGQQTVSIYVHGMTKVKDKETDKEEEKYAQIATASSYFFHDIKKDRLESANALALYNLSPTGTCKFRNIEMCNEICQQSNEDLAFIGGIPQFGFNLMITVAAMAMITA